MVMRGQTASWYTRFARYFGAGAGGSTSRGQIFGGNGTASLQDRLHVLDDDWCFKLFKLVLASVQ